jgi:molybdate transport system substrate-binding protein
MILTVVLAAVMGFPALAGAADITAAPTAYKVSVDGGAVAFDAYNIGGSNYFKLRDLAAALSSTAAQFEVSWDSKANTIAITGGSAYTSVGGELASRGTKSYPATATAAKITLDGKALSLTAYNIEGNNYFKLRDIAEALDFGVDYTEATKEVFIYSASDYAMAPVTLNIFAAASMTETINEITELYKAAAPNAKLVATFDSSGTLLTQIQEGAEADVFISAAQKQMNTLSDEKAVTESTRFDLVENKVVLVVPEGNPADIHAFSDVSKAKLIALGNDDVPVGAYAKEIFTSMGLWNDAFQKNVTFGSNVKEVTSWVQESVVDCGVVYGTDAYSAKLEIVANPPAGSLVTPVVYPAAVLAASKNQAAAASYLAFLRTPKASEVFKEVGFTIAD